MKSYVITIISLLISVCVSAYEPLIREGRIWEYSGNVTLAFDGTESISDTIYHRLVNFQNKNLIALMREENKKVYVRKTQKFNDWYNGEIESNVNIDNDEAQRYINQFNSSSEVLVYDFSAQKGDVFVSWSFSKDCFNSPLICTITLINETGNLILNDGNKYFFQTVFNDQTYIEGIGTLRGLLPIPENGPFLICSDSNRQTPWYLIRVYDIETEEILYGHPNGYNPILNSSYIWEYYENSGKDKTDYGSELYKIKSGVTESIGDYMYKPLIKYSSSKWNREFDWSKSEWSVTSGSQNDDIKETIGYFREQGGKLYIYINSDEIESYNPETQTFELIDISKNHDLLMFDFTKGVGEEFTAYCRDMNLSEKGYHMAPCKIVSISEEEGLRKYTIANRAIMDMYGFTEDEYDANYQFTSTFVEGIGNVGLGGFIPVYRSDILDNASWYSHTLNKVYNQSTDEVIFYGLNMDYPFAGINCVVPDIVRDDRIFDILGREICNPLPGTIYFRNGRKYIAQ